MRTLKLIILDCDDVLIDSEKLAQVKFIELLAARGVSIDEHTCQKEFTGLTVEAIYNRSNTKFNQSFSVDDMNELENQIKKYLYFNVPQFLELKDSSKL